MVEEMMIQWMTWLEWGAVAFNIGYVILAVRQIRWCWILGGIGVLLSFFVYVHHRLFSDATLQIFYFVLAVYGWWSWRSTQNSAITYTKLESRTLLPLLLLGGVGGLLLGWFWSEFGAAFPYWDGLTTSFSMIATWMVARRYLENWIFWIVIDLICVGVYVAKGIYPFAGLFILYVFFAVWGYQTWSKKGVYARNGDKDLIK